MKVKYILVVKDPTGKLVAEENELSGENVMRRALEVTRALIESWVIHGEMKFVSLTITEHD